MAPTGKNFVIEYCSDPSSTTNGGGRVRDANGHWWNVVDHHGPDQTGQRRAWLIKDGLGNQWIKEKL